MRPFEPQSGETLVEQPHYSAGNTAKQFDAIILINQSQQRLGGVRGECRNLNPQE